MLVPKNNSDQGQVSPAQWSQMMAQSHAEQAYQQQMAFARQQQILHFAGVVGLAIIVFLVIYWRRIARATGHAAKEGSLNAAAKGVQLKRHLSAKASDIKAEIDRRATAPQASDPHTGPRDNPPSS